MSSQDYYVAQKVLTDGDIPITHYVNKITGLNVFIADVESPVVYGDLCFRTEAFDDDGLPHTLEHLVFIGSEDYPYKGILDRLANICCADGTNAWTDTDHTNYTVCTAGSEGFLTLLPVYLDHLLFPTLTESAYVTEVHHVDGKGEDAGVVYCEMQARENTGDSRCYLEMLRSMYPGKCGYKSETGGLLKNLRESTTNEKCRNYHKEFYHTKNLAVIITGTIDAEEVFKAIKSIEDKVVSKRAHEVDFVQPWQSKVEPLESSCSRRIEYSSDTDDDGLVYIGFRGPELASNYNDLIALTILMDYLNSTSIAPIQRDFVECDEPYCSSVSHNFIENSTSILYLAFESVGKEYLDKVCEKLMTLFSNIRSGKEKFDMERLKVIISRKVVRILSVAESSPHNLVNGAVIGHFLYGKENNLDQRCREIPTLEGFYSKDAQFWMDLMDKYLIGPDARYVCIVGEPSPKKMKEMSKAEEERLGKQKESLADQLPLLSEKLKNAVEFNEKPAPDELLGSFKIPSTESIKYHSIERSVVGVDVSPVRIHYDFIKTNFVTIHLLLNTSNKLSKQDRLYLPLLTEIFLECSIKRGDTIVPYEKIVAELFSDTISSGSSIGISSSGFYSVGAISMLFGLSMQVEVDKYEKAVQWFNELLFQSVYTPERIKTIATRISSEISQYKRSGGKVTSACYHAMTYTSNSNQWACNFVRQKKFLKKVLSDLGDAQKQLTRIRDQLTESDNMLIHIACNKTKMDTTKLHEPWLKMFPEKISSKSGQHIDFNSITPCHKLFVPAEEPKAAIIGVGSVESNYLHQVVRSIDSPLHPDLPALYVLITYLTQLEGPLWRQLRGLGLTYSYQIFVSPSEGVLNFLLYKSSQLVAAYAKAKDILDLHLSGKQPFEEILFKSAKSSLIYEFIKKEKSAAGKSTQSLVAYLRGLDINYNRNLINSVAKVEMSDLSEIGLKYLKPIFEDEARRVVICCHPSKIKDIKAEFDNNLEVIDLENRLLTELD